jgi:hypothetical protein
MAGRQEAQRIVTVGTGIMRGLLAALCVGCAVGCALLTASAASAATVEPVSGDVSVNQGQGFKKLAAAFEAKVGDSVMVSPGGSAKISYADGCAIGLKPGAVMVITELSPCASGSNAEEDDHHDHTGALIYGTVVAGVTGFVIYEILQNTKTNHPVSP